MIKVGSLFSGIGGLDLGLERAGMEIVWQVENNSFCQKVLKKHWPEVPCYGDIKEIDFTTLPPVDLICGGFPCQPVSCAGKRHGDKDERWLWPEFYRAICEARPRWVLVENVPGLLSASNGRLFGGILGDLARSGYDAEWDLLPAAAFGAPHLRFRLFLVAYARSSTGVGRTLEPGRKAERGVAAGGDGEVVADPECYGLQRAIFPERGEGTAALRRRPTIKNCQDIAHAELWGLSQRCGIFARGQNPDAAITSSEWWSVEPDVGRVAHGIPSRVDRLKALGNAIVPQVAEFVGKRIMEVIDAIG